MVKNEYLLKTENLTIGYDSGNKPVHILKNINIGIYSGELVCLMGPNGIGKSTLIRTLSGLQKTLAGEVLMSGESLHEISAVDRSKLVSVVLTDRVQGGNLTVLELIEMGRYPYLNWFVKFSKDDKEVVSRAIEAIDLGDILNRKLFQLSDGQLQRTMIARALVQDSNVMILD